MTTTIAALTHGLCLCRCLTWDAINDIRPHPRRFVTTIFGAGMICTFYFGVKSIPWFLLASLLLCELLFRCLILAYLLTHLYVKSF